MTTIPTQRNAFLHGQWSAEDAAQLYGLSDWGKGYFGVGNNGNLHIYPSRDPSRVIDLHEVVEGLAERGLHAPVLLRFTDILADRAGQIRAAFDKAIKENEYGGGYSCVYPIKVNQQRQVCEEIRDIGKEMGFGLEAGSKPELLAVMGLTEGLNRMPIVCNGFKDDEYIEMVVLAAKLGRNITPIVEKFSELELIVKHAKAYGVHPSIGVRVKLSAKGAGRWESSAGARSKFGLFVSEVLAAVEYLREHEMLDCLQLLHCHVGSQVYDIRVLKTAINELSHIYTELARLGANMRVIDIGGGMGVDYDGSQTAWGSSVNYSIEEYAADVVYRIKAVCDDAGVDHPTIYSESGRALVAYSSVLVMDVLGSSTFEARPDIARIKRMLDEAGDDRPQPVVDLLDASEGITERNLMEVFHDATQARDEVMSLFNLGYMSLELRAAAEQLFWAIGRKLVAVAKRMHGAGEDGDGLPEELAQLPEALSDIYFCNFSVFQSLPDSWAIDQQFPICPIHRLAEQPTRLGVLADITCDSDGKIDSFVHKREDKRTLELHELREGEPYYLGAFLIGAYQEILGDMHNLFGDTHAVHVSLDGDGRWSIDEVVEADKVSDMLAYVQYDQKALRKAVRRDVERAVKGGVLSVREGKSLLSFYEQGLDGFTYLE